MLCLKRGRSLLSLMLMTAVSSMPALSQTATATISGRVTDSGAAVIGGATVELTSVERGTSSSVTTNEVGIYVFPSVPPGNYRMAARVPGFKQGEVQNLPVEVGSRIEQNFQLQVGSVEESL